MIFKKVFKMQKWAIGVLLFGFMCGACSKSNEDIPIIPPNENVPEVPDVTLSDTLDVKIGYNISVTEEELVPTHTKSRAGSNDIIGVQIYHLKATDVDWRVSYACGIFDDLDNIVFKFVKGNRYLIQMNYYPDAKNIVYNYPDGTFGSPFSYLYGLQSYKINEPVYFSGVEGGWTGDWGAVLPNLLDCKYQPTDDRYVQSFKRGMTPYYLGELEEIKIEDNTQIEMDLQLCMMGVTLNAGNFTSGTLNMVFSNVSNMEWVFKPEENTSVQFQIPYNYLWDKHTYLYDRFDGGDDMRLFYTSSTGEKYLLATKFLQWKAGVNYVFNFDLTERSDGSIGIKVPGNEEFQDEESFFD